jgi:hypothetical protein
MNALHFFSIACFAAAACILLAYIGVTTVLTNALRAVEYGLRLTCAVLATFIYVVIARLWAYCRAVWGCWRDEVNVTYMAVKDLLSMGLHGGVRDNLLAIILIEMLFLVFSFFLIVAMIASCIVSLFFTPFGVLIMAILNMAKRSCK